MNDTLGHRANTGRDAELPQIEVQGAAEAGASGVADCLNLVRTGDIGVYASIRFAAFITSVASAAGFTLRQAFLTMPSGPMTKLDR